MQNRALIIAAVAELIYMVATRLLLHSGSASSIDTEVLRSILRIATAAILWTLLQPLILSRQPNLAALNRPLPLLGLLAFFSVPLLVGNLQFPLAKATVFALTSLPVALHEEFLFRGVLQNRLAQKMGMLNAMLVSSVIFTAWHIGVQPLTFWNFGQIFLASMVLACVYLGSGSIWLVVMCHTLYDALFAVSPWMAQPLALHWILLPLLLALMLLGRWLGLGHQARVRPNEQ